jgi:hypothetical protein
MYLLGGFHAVAGVPSLAGVLAVPGVPACIFSCDFFAGVTAVAGATAVHGIPVVDAVVPVGFLHPCSLRYL